MKTSLNRVALLLLILTFLSPGVLRADVTGSILGVVRDNSQGVIGGARIVVTNLQTNFSKETVSAADGSYRILALPAGTYKLTVTASGFRTFVETDIDVKVNDQLEVDIILQVGSAQQEVISVEANAVQVQTESTQLGDVIDSKKMLALPLNGRSYIDLLGLQAGVAPGTSASIQQDRPVSGTLNPGNISVNGQRETANAFLVNGGDVSEGRNLGAGLVPNLDSVEEFRLITNSFDAEYGKFSGAVMNAITKSGTNSFHGDAFWFLRNDAFDANNYFANANGLGKTTLQRNQFGAVGGGAILKDRLFFFADYQGTRQTQGAVTTQSLPTADQRQGNFDPTLLTGTVDGPQSGTGGALSWAQVLSQRLGYPVNAGEPYSGCTSTAQCVFPVNPATGLANIPQAAWAAPAAKILPYIPAPTASGTVNNYTNNSQNDIWNDDKYGLKVDFINKKTGNWSWYYTIDNATVHTAVFAPGNGATVPGFPSETPSRAQEFVMSNTKTFGTTAVNEARFSFFRTALHKDNPAGSFASLSSLGFVTGSGTLGIIPSTTPGYPEYVPQMIFNNFTIGVPPLNTFQPNNTFVGTEVFSKAHGKHTLKFGGEFRYLQINERNYANPNGGFVFNGNATGSDFADFLLGAPATSGGYTQAALQLLDSRTRYGGAFAQDTWKVRPNLTLNLGLRWEVSMPWYDTQGKIQTFNVGEQSVVFPLAPNGLVFPGDPGIPKTLAPTKYDNFGPRLGLAYSPGFTDGALGKIFGGPGKTSIRAAFGLYYTSVEDLNLFYEVADAPFGLYWSTPAAVDFAEPFRIRTTGQPLGQRFPFTAPIPGAPSNKTLSFAPFEPFTFYPGYNIHNVLPYAEHFNLSIQREITKSTVLTAAYVGTGGHHLITQNEANPGNPTLCQQLTAQNASDVTAGVTGCLFNNENDVFQLPSAPAGTNCLTPSPTPPPGCVQGTRHGLLSPNYCPESSTLVCYGSNNTNTLTTANSIYNSGQISVQRNANDFSFLVAYTFAKALDDSSAFGDLVNFVNPRLSRGLSTSDITHNFVASYIWALPFDRLFANGPKRLTQGWQIQGITRFATGFPIPLNQANGDFTLWGSSATDMPDRVGPVQILNPRKPNPDCPTTDHTGCYFIPPPLGLQTPRFPGDATEAACLPSVGAFTQNCVPGTFGTANRRFFHGPGFNNTDFGLLKHTVIKENLAFDVRMEFFNIFNHAQFLNPGGTITNSSFGVVSSTRPPRIGQFSLKFYW
jgi:hypothetical protein